MRDTEKDFFRDDELVSDPYPYLAALRNKCPVRREPHHDVVMVTCYDEALAVLGDATTFSSCMSVTGPFPGFPVPLEGDDVSEPIASHRDAIPVSWVYDIDGTGTPIPGSPEEYPDKVANNPAEERAARALGWTGPALHAADEPPARVSVDAREYEELLALKRAQAQPGRTKMSGAARRKLARERGEQHA